MAVEILMPELGESVHEGTVSRWLKKVGDFVKEDEPVVEIMTDKVNTELGAPAAGVLSKILINEGEPVEVFAAMGLIDPDGTAGATTDAAPAADKSMAAFAAAPAPSAPVEVVPAPAEVEVVSPNGEKRWYTPVVKAMATEKGISDAQLASIKGTGEGGRVNKKDLEAFIASGAPAAPAAATTAAPAPVAPAPAAKIEPKAVTPTVAGPDQTVIPLAGMRKMIADHMVRSSAIPTVTTITEVDVTAMVAFRERNKDAFLTQYGVKLTYTPFFIKALTETLMEMPMLNSSLQEDNKILQNNGVNMGIAVALGAKGEGGLIVPVIRDTQKKDLIEIAKDLEQIAKKARSNSLAVTDIQGGTFTLTNPGTYGALFGTPMINAPQAGILGVYAIKKVPVIIDDMIAIRSVMHLVLTYDHRIIDGMIAGKFLAGVRDRLQQFNFFK